MKKLMLLICFSLIGITSYSQKTEVQVLDQPKPMEKIDQSVFGGIGLRNIAAAKISGRVVDVAIDPRNRSRRFAAVASGNVWRTINAGTTWEPVFDNYGSYSIGTVEIDPNNSNVVWVGTGENNSQRSVGLGDGVYKSVNGGETWTNMGLKTSEHIGKIVIDPRNSDIVYVAAQGPLWAPGGERGFYKTTDGGKNWERKLHISENTGISDIIYDPRNPDIILVSSYQRRRHFGMLVAGGPEGGIWKSIDSGETWNKLSNGLPKGDLGRIGLAISPQQPDVVYALIAGTDDTQGFYRSSNLGEDWIKMSDYMVNDAQYYMELFPDPHQFDKVYSVQTFIEFTENGGKSFERLGEPNKHVDNHEIEFDPNDPNYLLAGCDGGIYETWDKGKTWRFTENLPVSQFYKVTTDNSFPFYNIYGGTQDNASLGVPSRTVNNNGIREGDWFVTTGGDGFQSRVDPNDPNIVYSESQYGVLVRFDKRSGESINIQPQPGAREPALKWHWNAPLIISPFQGQRLYFAAEKLFRSDDRGNTWKAISGDLSRNLDRNKMEVMERVWGIDAIFKNVWTSPFGTIVSLDESPKKEGLIYVGTDDGLVQVTEDSGKNWRIIDNIPGIPKYAFVSDIHTSRHDPNTVFVVFNNFKYGDFKPYIVKSTDKGKTWAHISNNLPERDFCWSIFQDHVDPNLLFAGTEYGLYFSVDAGAQWIKLKKGMPTIAIRDLEIQTRENDLVAASFGRGFFVLDDYSFLRKLTPEILAKSAVLFPVKAPYIFQEADPDGDALGHTYFTSPNPEQGAVFTYYLKESLTTLKKQRLKAEESKISKNEPVYYPKWESMHEEIREENPIILFTIMDENNAFVKRITGPASKGLHRVSWDLRVSSERASNRGRNASGPFVYPGKYKVSLSQLINGSWMEIGDPQNFEVKSLNNVTLPSSDPIALFAFNSLVNNLNGDIMETNQLLNEKLALIESIKQGILNQSPDGIDLYKKAHLIQRQLMDFDISLNGDRYMVKKMELIPPSITSRVRRIMGNYYSTTSDPTNTQKDGFQIAELEFKTLRNSLNYLIENDLMRLEQEIERQKIRY